MATYTIVLMGSGGVMVVEGDQVANLDDGSGADEFFTIDSPTDLDEIERDLGEQNMAEARAQIALLEIMTAVEIAAEFDTSERNVRMAAERHAVKTRQSGKTWLILRSEAERMWKRRVKPE